MSIQDLLHWWNLIYALPLLMSLIWILTTVFAGVHGHDLGHGDHSIGHEASNIAHDVGHSINHVFHHDAGMHANGSAHGANHSSGNDSNAHSSSDTDDSFLSRACWLLGIGNVPITMLAGIFSLSWGVIGLMMNQLFAGSMKYPAVYVWPSMGIAFVSAFIVTRSMAAVINRIIPGDETYGVSRLNLVGLPGKTIFATNDRSGTVDVKDMYGNIHRVQAKVEDGISIPPSTEVIIIDFDDSDKRFIVRKGTM